jgi:predicted amidohydrolase
MATPAVTPPGALVVCQMEVLPGNPEANLARIKRGIDEAAAGGASLVVFPEMALPGYLIGDDWENDALLRDLADMNAEIVAHTRGRCAAVWGSVAAMLDGHVPVLGRVEHLFAQVNDGDELIVDAGNGTLLVRPQMAMIA